MTEGMSAAQLSVCEPPYADRLDRPILNFTRAGSDGSGVGEAQPTVEVRSRPQRKKAFDQAVNTTPYF